VVKPAVVEVDGEAVELLACVLVVPDDADGVGAFTASLVCASCARNCVPPKTITAHATPIAIRSFTRLRVSWKSLFL
jgi:hypothetical protein